MKTVTKQFTYYDFSELKEEAKEKAIQNYLDDNCDIFNSIFFDDCMEYLAMFKYSSLDVEYDFSCCQGSGLNIYGDFVLSDFLPFWEATEEERKIVENILKNNIENDILKFSQNNHYTYSRKFIDRKEYTAGDFMDTSENIVVFQKYIDDIFSYFEKLENEFYKNGENILNCASAEDVEEWAICNGFMFDENGKIIYEY